MSEHDNEYPLMLYQGGDTSSAYIIVTDADEEKLAAADGFLRHGETSASGDTPLTATQLKEELTKRNIALVMLTPRPIPSTCVMASAR
jgi:hypothetical protein